MADKILIVEDDKVLVEIISYFAESEGIHVVSAIDGIEGLCILKQDLDIKLAVCDLNMPRMGGIGFLNECSRAYPECPIIILTGDPESARQQDSTDKAYAVVPKPFDSLKLFEVIHAGLNRSKKARFPAERMPGSHSSPLTQRSSAPNRI